MIAIKDIQEMPKRCFECHYFDDYCDLTGKWVSDTAQIRDGDCPLVEIVTCKDCKHLCHIEDAPKILVCGKHNCQQVSKNYYCADGERREK